MAVGAFLEPFVVVSLLFGGAWFNRNKDYDFWKGTQGWAGGSTSHKRRDDFGKRRTSTDSGSPTWSSGSSSPTLSSEDESSWSPTSRRRNIRLFGFKKTVTTPNTLIFKDRLLSRVLQKFPFLVEAWYWALIYWVSRAADICCRIALFRDLSSIRLISLELFDRYTNWAERSLRSPLSRELSMSRENMPLS